MLSHVSALAFAPTLQRRTVPSLLHILRWKDRPLPCPRCQSHHIGRWGTYHYRPECKRSWCQSCKRTFNDLTHILLHQGQRPLAYWLLATFLSGTSVWHWPSIEHTGNGRLRTALYMATLSAAQHNPMIKALYTRLRAAGKPEKVARCASARKLLHIAWAVVRKTQWFDPSSAPQMQRA
jgi:transposase-like protein